MSRLKVQKWTQNDTKVTFQPHTAHPPPTRKLFLVSNGQNKTFLLRCYGIDFAPIKRYHSFCFLWLYIRRQRLSLYDLSQLSVLYLSVCLFFFFCVCLLFFVCSLFCQYVCLSLFFSLSFPFFLFFLFFLFVLWSADVLLI